jgi:hypothetical protein
MVSFRVSNGLLHEAQAILGTLEWHAGGGTLEGWGRSMQGWELLRAI